MRDRAVILAMEDATNISGISAIVEPWVGPRLLIRSLSWIPLLRGRSSEGKPRRVVLVLFRLGGIVAILLIDTVRCPFVLRVHLLLPPANVAALVIHSLFIVVAVAEWRRWRSVATTVVLLASTVAVGLTAQDGPVPRLVATAWVARVRHHVRGSVVRVGRRLARALSQQLLGEAGLIVVVPGLPHLHLEFDLVLRRIVRRCLTLRMALHTWRPQLAVGDVVVAAIDHFLRVGRYVATAEVGPRLRLAVLVLQLVPLLFVRLSLPDGVHGVRKILLLALLVLHLLLELLLVGISERIVDSLLVDDL